jgi:hypothetical protein
VWLGDNSQDISLDYSGYESAYESPIEEETPKTEKKPKVEADFLRAPPPPKNEITPPYKKRKSETPAASESEARRQVVVLDDSPKAKEAGAASEKAASSKGEAGDSATQHEPSPVEELNTRKLSTFHEYLKTAIKSGQIDFEKFQGLCEEAQE